MNNTYFNNAPGIGKLYETVIPALGHDTSGAFLDLLDNCDDAGATRMEIQILTDGPTIIGYAIIDNGVGMDITTLVESYRFATMTSHSIGDLGKFGVGGTIASFTLANKKITITKTDNGKILVAEQNLKWFDDPNHDPTMSCMVREPTDEERAQFEKHCGNQGTIILLSELKKQQYIRGADLKNRLLKDIGMTFYEKIGVTKKISILYKGKRYRVFAKDPLYFNQKDLLTHYETHDIDYNGHSVKMKIVEINPDKFDQKDKSYSKQGLYIKRNGRLIMTGVSDPVIWKKNPRFNTARIEISFSEALDHDFALSATKNKIVLSQGLQDKLWEPIKQFRKKIDKQWRHKPPTNEEDLSKEEKNFSDMLLSNAGIIDLPRHPSAPMPSKPKVKSNGTSNQKPNGKKQKQKPKGRMVPMFRLENHLRSKEHFWIEGFDDGKMTIVINTANEFIKQFYVNGHPETKRALRIEWAAQCLSEWSFRETNEEDAVITHRERTSEKISKIYGIVK